MKKKTIRKEFKQIISQMHMQRFRRNHHMCYSRPTTMNKLFKTPYGQKLTTEMIDKIGTAFLNVIEPEPEQWWNDEYHYGSILKI